MKVLVTGGLGYIGSHTVLKLIEENHEVVILDNISNSKKDRLKKLRTLTNAYIDFYEVDILDTYKLMEVFQYERFDAVLHFAALKYVGESFEIPLEYYETNVAGTINLLKACERYKVKEFIFSSSAIVYGDAPPPLTEDVSNKHALNPYGRTKAMCEEIIKDYANSTPGFKAMILRYFNPIGAHKSGMIGEYISAHTTNIMPVLMQALDSKAKKFKIFGDSYDTKDGTTIRDYVHVEDLAEGHVKALSFKETGAHVFNLGTGVGTTVLDLVTAMEEETDETLEKTFEANREGDIPVSVADVEKANQYLNYKTNYGIKEMCRDSWNYYKEQTEHKVFE